ncbi:uncharacterized protein V1518DRAFT_377307 [Limtongia smithiae]|uniref:uncharacterized protein n=1 Tax=Limtongia smithiae TaxID=1125753 RepID=UPI0034CEAF74
MPASACKLSLVSLPAEILNNIFDHIVADRHATRRRQLLPLGRTCSKLCDEVNRYLYFDIKLDSPLSFDKLVSTLLTSPTTIAPLVHSFSYTAPGEFTPRAPSGYLPSDLTPVLTHLPTILHLCPNMENLSLDNLNDITLKDWEHLFPTSAVALRRIRRFTWSYYSGWRRGRNFSRVWFKVLSRFTALTQLRLANCVIDPEAMDDTPHGSFFGVTHLILENICWSMQDMDMIAALLPNVHFLDLKTIKVFPYPNTPYHPLPPMFKRLRSLIVDCPTRILSPNHHICAFLEPSLKTSLEYLSVTGGCSLCPLFFKGMRIGYLSVRLSQLRICNGFESARELNDAVIENIRNQSDIKRVVIEAPSLAVVDKNNVNHGGMTDIGRRGHWILADVDMRDKSEIAAQSSSSRRQSSVSSTLADFPDTQIDNSALAPAYNANGKRVQIVGISEDRILELEAIYRQCMAAARS